MQWPASRRDPARVCGLTCQVVVDHARQQPFSGVVRHHLRCSAGGREKTDRVSVVVLRGQDLAVEVN